MTITYQNAILSRSLSVWGGLRTRPYKMTWPNRADCSLYIWDVFDLPMPYGSTVNIVNYFDRLPSWNACVPGDIWGRLGPGTEGSNGHVALIVGTPKTHGRWVIRHQAGPTGVYGPTEVSYSNPPSGFAPYRIKEFTDGSNEEMTAIVRVDDGAGRYLTNGLIYRDLVSEADMNRAMAMGASLSDAAVTPFEHMGVNIELLLSSAASAVSAQQVADLVWAKFKAQMGK